MDVKLSASSPSLSSGKKYDFCDDLSEHGYGSLEDLHCPITNGSPIVQGCDVSSSPSLPATITTTTITSSSPSSSSTPPLSSSSSIDSIASLNNSSSQKSTESSQPASTSPGKNCNTSHLNVRTTGDQDSDNNNNQTDVNSPTILDNSVDNCLHRFAENSSGESRNDRKIDDTKVQPPSPQMLQSGNRFRFVPKNRQANPNDTKCKGAGTFLTNGRNNNNRGSRKGSRSECEHENRKRSQMRNKSNEDIVFIIKKVDRSLRRTVSESSGETLPVRGILKYPRDWNRRTLSESNCDNSDRSNLMDSHENGQTQSLECISPLEASCEASTESACSSAGESPGNDEEKPKKSVHFNCYVSKATFNINSVILNNNKHSGSNKKKNRRLNNNDPSSNYNHNINDHKNTSTPTINTNATKQNTNHKNHKDNHPNKHSSRWKSQQSLPRQQHVQQNDHLQQSNNHTKTDPTKASTDPQSVNFDAQNIAKTIVTDSVIISSNGDSDNVEHCENIDPMETKMRSRQDSGYDSETSERKGFVEDSGTTTCVKSPNRQFTVKKVDLN